MQYITDTVKDIYYWWNEPKRLPPLCKGFFVHKSGSQVVKDAFLEVILTVGKHFYIRRPDHCMIIGIPNVIDFEYVNESVIELTIYPNKKYTIEIFKNENNEFRCRFLSHIPKNTIVISTLDDHPDYTKKLGWILT
jgi:hypothetical protein